MDEEKGDCGTLSIRYSNGEFCTYENITNFSCSTYRGRRMYIEFIYKGSETTLIKSSRDTVIFEKNRN